MTIYEYVQGVRAEVDYNRIEEIVRKYSIRFYGISQTYGFQPAYLFMKMLEDGARILNETYFDEPPSPTAALNINGSPNASISIDEDGYHITDQSPDGSWAEVGYQLFDISSYDKILILAGMKVHGGIIISKIYLLHDTLNFYNVELKPSDTGSDFAFVRRLAGSYSNLVYESVDLAYDTVYHVAWYYDRTSGRHIVWRDGVRKFDIIETNISPSYVCIGCSTTETSTQYADIVNPIIVVAL